MFKKIFRGSESKNKENHISEIGLPTNVVRGIHVSKNNETGTLEGLPPKWQQMLESMITKDERSENPDAGMYKNIINLWDVLVRYVTGS